MKEIVSKIKRYNPDLKEAEIEGLLNILFTNNKVEMGEMIRLTGIPRESLKVFIKSISFILEDKENFLQLSEKGKDELKALKPRAYNWNLYTPDDRDIAKKLFDIRTKYVARPKREYDQFFATPETSVAKVEVMMKKGMVEDKRILLIGDDDLVSITLALMCPNYREIVVVDIDDQILNLVNKIANDLKLDNIKTEKYDVREVPSDRYLGCFDVVVTDPPYTKSGITLFLNRAVQFLGKTNYYAGKYVFLYYGNSFKSPEKVLKIQEIIQKFNLVIEDRVEKFARYFGAESIGSASSLYILKLNKFTQELDPVTISNKIYTFEDQKEEKFPFVDHLVFKLNGLIVSDLKSKNKMLENLGIFCKLHKLKVVDKTVTSFKGGGLTITLVLANSNLVAHTWPEHRALHLDLITCSPIFNKDRTVQTLSTIFKTNKIEVTRVE